ncbi:MAG: hypothetical protein AAGG48_03115 [Planctomycetota bacterium]
MAIVLPKFSRRRSSAGSGPESQPALNLTLCREDGLYYPGETLKAGWRISRVPVEEITGLELSVLWYTEGKGDEDFHVHHFHRLGDAQIRREGMTELCSTQCALPATPLSYQGKLISVCWCIRLRLFLACGREIVSEQPFYLINPVMVSRSAMTRQQQPDSNDEASDVELANSANQEAASLGGSDRSMRSVRRFSGPSSAT